MGILKKLNVVRKAITRNATKNIGKSYTVPTLAVGEKATINRVLICRPNHRLGNLLLITPLIEELNNRFPDCKVDVFAKGGLGNILFKNHTNVDKVIQLPRKPLKQLPKYIAGWIAIKSRRYDIAINVVSYSSSGKLSTQKSNSTYKIFGAEADELTKYPDYAHVAKYPVYCLRNFLTLLGYPEDTSPAPLLDLKLDAAEIAHGKQLLNELIDANKKTIAIFTYATGAKCYPPSWWEPVYESLKAEFAGYNIIEVLPVENVSQIDFKAPTFYSKDVREIAAVIANCQIFFGADSGIMHLASAAQTPTVGLFSITKPDTFKPYGNKSIAIDTNTTSTQDIIKAVSKILN
ncbi:glycosyltransferase family 9 protein [Flavobacterium subsaxonicum]|uniref:ADP-heptose--LPS heptosyltransferase n=1 Tax=Flavobacterium subsaxonicum WB 4.1-42 = DSM 21790 TaxID=1121898 RepID=A0A0A2MHS6_9FLAO|nr:glycosyltransferase family 9 protein [Flavobacterium subsaxonicum]KGO91859.1 ADP-heptose--LPS heptosyltransferase [Flavobacterium subsaxonicum WB 4.1-42 = DSM 21790]